MSEEAGPVPVTADDVRAAAWNSAIVALLEAGLTRPAPDVVVCIVRAAVDSTLYLVTDMLDAEEAK